MGLFKCLKIKVFFILLFETFIALDECTILEKIIAKALLKSSATGSLYALDILLNRTQGLPRQETEITVDNHIFVADFGST